MIEISITCSDYVILSKKNISPTEALTDIFKGKI